MRRATLQQAFLKALKNGMPNAERAAEVLSVFDQYTPERCSEALTGKQAQSIYEGSAFRNVASVEPTLIVGLVERGLPVNYPMTETETPLLLAITAARSDLVERLLDLGADATQVMGGRGPLGHCAQTTGSNDDESWQRKRQELTKITEMLCAHGAPVDGNGEEQSPLGLMAARGLIESALVLVRLGALRELGQGSNTPVDLLASQCGQEAFAQQIRAAFELRALEADTGPAHPGRGSLRL